MVPSKLHNESTDRLAKAFLSLQNVEECYSFFEDLLTVREIQDFSQRLDVARMLRNKATYTEIVDKTGVSTATIGRVNRALNYGADGYRLVLDREEQEIDDD